MHELVPKSALIVLMGRHVNKNTHQKPNMKIHAIVPLNNHNQTICKPWKGLQVVVYSLCQSNIYLKNTLLASGRFHCFSHNKHKWTERKNTIVREVRVS
jgi:hypothetical protein